MPRQTDTAVDPFVPFGWDAAKAGIAARPLVYAIIVGIFAIDLVWCHQAGLAIGGWERATSGVVVLLLIGMLYRRRSRGLADMAESAALWIAFTAAGCVLTYLCQSLDWPLRDATLTAFDRSLGFDWLAVRNTVLAWPALHVVLFVAYACLLPQMILAAFFFPAVGLTGRGIELLLLAEVTLLPTALISALWPALGPFATFGGTPGYLPHVLALRTPGPWHFSLMSMEGVITMPSYHLVLAMLFTYAFRGTGIVGWGVAALNFLLVLSIAPIGGHYLVDLCAGAPIALVSILVARLLLRDPRELPAA